MGWKRRLAVKVVGGLCSELGVEISSFHTCELWISTRPDSVSQELSNKENDKTEVW